MPRPPDATPAVTASGEGAGLVEGIADLYWIPLGAGGHSVRFNGIVYEALSAAIHHRARFDIYHCALTIRVPTGVYTVEMTPVPNRRGWERGVVVEGAVGARWAGRLRIFRYEVRCWRSGVIPDLQHAIGGPVRLADDAAVAEHILELLPWVPALTWGRDESGVGEMWSCNSIVSWVLSRAGVDTDAISLPSRGRAPGWDAGVAVATKQVGAAPTVGTGRQSVVRLIHRRRPAAQGARLGAPHHLPSARRSRPSYPGRVRLQQRAGS
jgi:hypothetical protein